MISFFKKTSKYNDLSDVNFCFHNHVLPGIDDGATDLESSLSLIEGMQNLGITEIAPSPHQIPNHYNPKKSEIEQAFLQVTHHLPSALLPHHAEHFWDEHLIQGLQQGQYYHLAKAYILIEFPYYYPESQLQAVLNWCFEHGKIIILAHPERYMIPEWREKMRDLREKGVKFQLNALSLIGYYGKDAQKQAKAMIDGNVVDYFCTDLHNHKYLELLKKVPASPLYSKLIDSKQIRNQYLREKL